MYTIEKKLAKNNTIIGYKTSGLIKKYGKELSVNVHLNEYIVKSIFDMIVEKYEKIPDTITGITNMNLHIKENDKEIIIIIPDKNGKYPEDIDCDNDFKNQIF